MKKISNNPAKKYAASLMTSDVPVVSKDNAIGYVEEHLLKNIKRLKSVNYIYVLGKENILEGVISIKELFRQPKAKKISSVMNKNLKVAYAHTDQEKVAYLALKNNIKSVPIVDQDGKFLGAVLNDDIMNIVYNELEEDVAHFAGVGHHAHKIDDINSMSLATSLKHRLPWLIVGILGGLVAAQVIGLFERTLSENIILAAFIPLIVYIASAVSTQISFFVVRDLAISKKINLVFYSLRQFNVVLFMSAIISILIFIISLLFYNELLIAAVLSISIFLTILSSIITGLFIPFIFNFLRFDPANASGPIGTIIQDLISVSIYLLVAGTLL